jgi:hypothetical protein
VEALRRAADATAPARPGLWATDADDPDRTQALAPVRAADNAVPADADADDPDRTQALAPVRAADNADADADADADDNDNDADDDDTRPFTAKEERTAAGERLLPLERGALPPTTHRSGRRGVGAWVAVAALALFAFVLLGLILGFLV